MISLRITVRCGNGGGVCRALRANVWLIILLLILGAAIGFGVNFLLEKFRTRYTASALVVVQPPAGSNLLKSDSPPPFNLAEIKVRQKSQIDLLTDPTLFSDVLALQNADLHNCDWFKSFGDPQDMKKDMAKHFRVFPVRETSLLKVSFTAADAVSAKNVLKAIVDDRIRLEKIADSHIVNDRLVTLKTTQSTYDMRRATLGSDISDLQAQLQQLGSFPGQPNIKQLQMQQWSDQLIKANIEKAAASERSESTSPLISPDQVHEAKQRLAELTSITDSINESMKRLGAELANMGDLQTRLTQKQTELQYNESKAQKIQDELDSIEQLGQKQQYSSIDWAAGPPETPEAPTFPRLGITILVFTLAGLLLALLIIFCRSRRSAEAKKI